MDPEEAISLRLKNHCPALSDVHAGLDWANAHHRGASFPGAFVFLVEERAEPNRLIGGFRQKRTARISVVLIAKGANDPTGEKVRRDMAGIRRQVRRALVGWSPISSADPIAFSGGRLLSYAQGLAFWQEIYLIDLYGQDGLEDDIEDKTEDEKENRP